jgi:hypothetical protein
LPSSRQRARLEERQRQIDSARGRSADDDSAPPDGDGKPPRKSRFKYKFGEPKPKAQDNFTDPESRIMKRAGGGFDYADNAQTAVDDTAHIIVAAELTDSAADSGQLPTVLAAVTHNTGGNPTQVVADAGYRSEAVFELLCEHPSEVIVAPGREGKSELGIDAKQRPPGGRHNAFNSTIWPPGLSISSIFAPEAGIDHGPDVHDIARSRSKGVCRADS